MNKHTESMMQLVWPKLPGKWVTLMQVQVDFASDCTRLQAITPDSSHISTQQFQKLVEQVASESAHDIFEVPTHLQVLLIDMMRSKWAMDCEQQCLTKFLALIADEADIQRREG